jgi:cAMP-dependent protein kinase regulator
LIWIGSATIVEFSDCLFNKVAFGVTMDTANRRERPSTDLESVDASIQNGNSFEPTSRRRSESLRSRISMFDYKKPSHLPVKEGSPVVTREKLSRRAVFSPRSPIPSTLSELSAVKSGLSTQLNELPFCDIDNSNSVEDSVQDDPATARTGSDPITVFTGSDGVAADYEGTLSQDEPKPGGTLSQDEPKPVSTGNSLQERLQMFEQRNREAIDDNSVQPRTSEGTRTSFNYRTSRRGSTEHQIVGASEHSVTERSIESSKSFSDFDEDTPQKKSWKPKRVVPTVDTGASVGIQPVHEQGHNGGDSQHVTEVLNDTKEVDTRNRKSWKTKRVISVEDGCHVEEQAVASSLQPLSDHSTGQNFNDTESPKSTVSNSSVSKSTKEKTLKLQDRINMFNKPSSPTPQKAFLSSHYMRKLIAKKSGGNASMDMSTISESDASLTQSVNEVNSAFGNASIDGSFRFDELHVAETEEPKMSLDRSMVWEKQLVDQKRTKSFGRRGELKQHNSASALIRQKNKDKNAVFAIKEEEEVSDSAFPEYAKDPTETKIIVTALRKNFVFEDMDEKEMSKLVAAMEEVEVARGKDIITQGEPGDYFYVVAKGEVEFFIDGQRVGAAGPGNAFGELALLYRCPRSATVRAMDRATSLFRVDQKTFTVMMQSETKKSEDEKRELLQKVPFLSSLGAEDITRLCSLMGPVLFSTGDYIVRKGDQGSSFFIIRDGKARVTEIFVGGTSYEDISLERGDYFGEDALVSNEPRAANVVALTKGSAFAIDRESVCKVLGDFGSLISKTQDRQKLVRSFGLISEFVGVSIT